MQHAYLCFFLCDFVLFYLTTAFGAALFSCLIFQIEIKELDDFAQIAFDGYETLNRIQSRIFPTSYYSNENILVMIFNLLVDCLFSIFL